MISQLTDAWLIRVSGAAELRRALNDAMADCVGLVDRSQFSHQVPCMVELCMTYPHSVLSRFETSLSRHCCTAFTAVVTGRAVADPAVRHRR